MHKHSNTPESFDSKEDEQSPMATVIMVTAVVGALGIISSAF
ncbi:hypothetical protein MMIC_P1564 [Mariprofundus micogutta]|uniref:Uncharacterized protein n=1 Tax=Mariprofundus micogutta TaxID=1921010 RepID=A0A1L8CNU8_9PROT|nr:hypothetical protein [Mariprofundus micogutta]GAV20595.1 hypothetical protein MMIC_P1564 [Mariprofundus micogutta]